MLPRCPASRALVFTAMVLGGGPVHAEVPARQGLAPAPALAVADFGYVDTSGEAADQTAAHQARLQSFMTALRDDLPAGGRVRVVPLSCGQGACAAAAGVPDLARMAAAAGASILIVGGIHKRSTLIQTVQVQAFDTGSDRVVLDRFFTFRGDNDTAWDRAEAFMARDLRDALSAP